VNKKQPSDSKENGVFFSQEKNQNTDKNFHADMLESVASVADEAGIRSLMNIGLSHEEACKLVYPNQPISYLKKQNRI